MSENSAVCNDGLDYLTKKSTSYFFCFGPWAKVGGDPDMHRKAFADLGLLAFSEDRTMLTAQQQIIDADPSRRMVLFDVDKAPMLYRRLVEKLMKEESAAA